MLLDLVPCSATSLGQLGPVDQVGTPGKVIEHFGPSASEGLGTRVKSRHQKWSEGMRVNMGRTDRLIRGVILTPLLLVIAYFLGFGTVGGVVAAALAAVMFATAAIGTCPLYLPFGINTNRSEVKTD